MFTINNSFLVNFKVFSSSFAGKELSNQLRRVEVLNKQRNIHVLWNIFCLVQGQVFDCEHFLKHDWTFEQQF